jgi:hypothetical protein
VPPGMVDVGVVDPVFASGRPDLHTSRMS